MGPRRLSRLTEFYSTEEWVGWVRIDTPGPYLTDDEVDQLLTDAGVGTEDRDVIGVTYRKPDRDGDGERLETWRLSRPGSLDGVTWRRTTGQALAIDHNWVRAHDNLAYPETGALDGVEGPWNRGRVLVAEGPGIGAYRTILAEKRAANAERAARHKEEQRIQRLAADGMSEVRKQYIDRWREGIIRKLESDGVHPDLVPDHLKTMKAPNFPPDDAYGVLSRNIREAVETAITKDEHAVTGLTLGEIVGMSGEDLRLDPTIADLVPFPGQTGSD